MASWEHIEYDTKLITIPVVTARDHEYPDRIGPWRIRRTQSVPNSSTSSSEEEVDSQSELQRLLTRVDEQCSQIDSIIKLDVSQPTGTISEKVDINDIERDTTFKGSEPVFPRNIWFFWLWLLCTVVIIANYIAILGLLKLLHGPPTQKPSKAELYMWMAACGFAAGWVTGMVILLVMAVESGRRVTRRTVIPIAAKGLVPGLMAGCLALVVTYSMY